MGDLFLGGAELAQCRGRHQTDQQPEDREDDEELEQGKALLAASAAGRVGQPAR